MSEVETSSPQCSDVPTRIVEEFLLAIPDHTGKTELVNRLRKTLLKDRCFTERGLRAAVLGEDFQL